jgi:fructose-bisphosphate aldolase class I
MVDREQFEQMKSGAGFVAALDQSGGSTPKALGLYGVNKDSYSNDTEMFDLMHAMRARIAKSPAFTGDKIIGVILFEMTMDDEIDGIPTATYMWEKRHVVPFLKVDKGLQKTNDGVCLMKPIDGLDATLERAKAAGIFGTKMRSVIEAASPSGIAVNVAQQIEIGQQILKHGLMPILEPEISISIDDKAEAEQILLAEITKQLDTLEPGQQVMLKLTLPEQANLYQPLAGDPRILRVVALSGGYTRDEANARLTANTSVVASFSRALTQGLSVDQDDAAFDANLSKAIGSIHAASVAG